MKKIFLLFIFLIIFDYYLSASCETFKNGCLKCNPLTNLCFRCEYDVLAPDKKGGCTGAKKCIFGNNYCGQCNIEGNLCTSCEEGYFPDENGGCSYSENCEISYNGECLKCKKDYILIGKTPYYDDYTLKICKSLSSSDLKHCKTVDETDGLCLKCESGYHISKGDKKCTKVDNCNQVTNGECTSCINNYYFDKKQNKCIEKIEQKFKYCKVTLNGENCEKCDVNYFLSDDLNCVNTNYCSKSKNETCTECIKDFYLTENNKCSFSKNCKDVDPKNGICTKCSNNYYFDLKSRNCEPYLKNDNTKYCSKFDNNCIQCIEGYYLAGNNACSATKNCSMATDGECTTCQEGFSLTKDNKCTEVEHCIYLNDKLECIECEDNFYYNNFTKKCQPVEDDTFKNCKYSDNLGEKCSFCKKDFYINLSDNLCYSNAKNGKFYKCVISLTGENCTQCEKEFNLGYGDNKCTSVKECYKSNDKNECQECEEDYCLNKKTSLCEWNYLIENESQKVLFKCKMTNSDGTACVSCEDRFEVGNEGVCVDKVDCEENNGDKCTKCVNTDEEGNSHCLNNLYGCVETYVSNCAKCNDNLDVLTHCTECDEGYKLDENNSCVLIEEKSE